MFAARGWAWRTRPRGRRQFSLHFLGQVAAVALAADRVKFTISLTQPAPSPPLPRRLPQQTLPRTPQKTLDANQGGQRRVDPPLLPLLLGPQFHLGQFGQTDLQLSERTFRARSSVSSSRLEKSCPPTPPRMPPPYFRRLDTQEALLRRSRPKPPQTGPNGSPGSCPTRDVCPKIAGAVRRFLCRIHCGSPPGGDHRRPALPGRRRIGRNLVPDSVRHGFGREELGAARRGALPSSPFTIDDSGATNAVRFYRAVTP
jgi:hypothetical protein